MTCRDHATPVEDCCGCAGRWDRAMAERAIEAYDLRGIAAATIRSAIAHCDRLQDESARWYTATAASFGAQRAADLDEAAATYEAMRAEIVGLRMDVDRATGPHCSSCGNAIDPDCCWCGEDHGARHDNIGDGGHHFIPMGCDCERAERDWQKLAGNLRELARKQAAELEALRCGDLVPFHDHELSPEREAAFREHLQRCVRCQTGLGGLMQEAVTTSEVNNG